MTPRPPDPTRLATRLAGTHSAPEAGQKIVPDAAAVPTSFAIRIARDGTWFYHGSPIARKPLVRLFSRVLRREPDGTYWLVTPVERGRIEVDDAPFTAVELKAEGSGRSQRLAFRTNVDEVVVAGAEHPIRVQHDPATGEPAPYILVRPGLEALIVRPVYYQLVELGVERRQGAHHLYGVWSEDRFFVLGTLEETA